MADRAPSVGLFVHIVIGASLFAAGWFAAGLVRAGGASAQPAPRVPAAVRVSLARKAALNPVTEYVGHVEPVEETEILPQIDGYVKKVCFAEGAHVAAGDLLFEIDDEQYQSSYKLRKAEVVSAQAQVLVAKSEVDCAERLYNRLASADERGVLATDRDNAETALAAARAKYNAANAAVEQAAAAVAIAAFNLKHTKVYAPIAGRIGKSFHHVGDYVSPSKSALAKIVRLDPIRVAFPITDRDYDSWQESAERRGTAVNDSRRMRLRLASGEEYRETGKIAFGDNEMSRTTGTLVLHVAFANPAGRLVPNAFVRVLSDEANPTPSLVVPAGAIELADGGHRVWILDAEGKAQPVAVTTGVTWEGQTQILSGLDDGARVIVAGAFKLTAGESVKVAE